MVAILLRQTKVKGLAQPRLTLSLQVGPEGGFLRVLTPDRRGSDGGRSQWSYSPCTTDPIRGLKVLPLAEPENHHHRARLQAPLAVR